VSPVDCSLSGQDGTAGAVALRFLLFFLFLLPSVLLGCVGSGEMELGWGKQRCKWETAWWFAAWTQARRGKAWTGRQAAEPKNDIFMRDEDKQHIP
jgi:hypothetical protein